MEARLASGDDCRDRYWAAAISIALHLVIAICVMTGTSEMRPGKSTAGAFSGSLSLHLLGEDEFRQPLVALSVSKSIPASDPEPEPEVITVPTPVPSQAAEVAMTEALLGEQVASETSVVTTAQTMPSTGPAGQAVPSVEMPLEAPRYDSREHAYLTALRAAIQSKWARSHSQSGRCAVTIQQAIGGQVTAAITKSCSLGQADRKALEAAVLAAQPLPYAGFEGVFREQITVEMEE